MVVPGCKENLNTFSLSIIKWRRNFIMTNRNLLSKKIILGLATATLCYGPFGVGYAGPANDALPTGANVTLGNVTISTTTATE